MKPDKFTFFASYHAALDNFDDARYGRFVRAICGLVFGQTKPSFETADDRAIWALIEPILAKGLELSEMRAKAGSNGGKSKTKQSEANAKQTEANLSKSEANESGIGIGIGNRNKELFLENTPKATTTTETETEKVTKRPKNFRKPTIGEVTAYISEKGYSLNAQTFYDYYTANGWKVGRNQMKDWKAAVRTWQGKEAKRQADNSKLTQRNNFKDTDTWE